MSAHPLQQAPTIAQRRGLLGWLLLAVIASAVSLGYGVALILVRAGWLHLPGGAADAFHTALVLHVDFALLVWFLSVAAMLWSWWANARAPLLGYVALCCAVVGVVTMAAVPLLTGGTPVMADYIPVLDQPVFLAGLGLFAVGVLLAAVRAQLPGTGGFDTLRLGLQGSAAVTLLAALVLLIALVMQPFDDPLRRFEYLFWGAGHQLQINHLMLLFLVWSWFLPQPSRLALRPLLIALLLLALSGPLLALLGTPNAQGQIPGFTAQMAIAGSLALAWSWRVWRLRSQVRERDEAPLLRAAFLLFLAGTLLGLVIERNDALVPAHYHGVIGAVTLSFMALIYRLLAGIGFRVAAGWIGRQAWCYGGGMAAMMAGLVVADLPRKAAFADLSPQASAVAGRALTGIGGSLALFGTLLFVLLVWRALAPRAATRSTLEEMDGR